MGAVVELSSALVARNRFRQTVENIQGFALFTLQVHPDQDVSRASCEAIRLMLEHPLCPFFEADDDQISRAAKILAEAVDDEARRATLTLSLSRFRREVKLDPLMLPRCQALIAGDSRMYLLLSKALGVAALLWQIDAHPDALILTEEDFHLCFYTKTPSG